MTDDLEEQLADGRRREEALAAELAEAVALQTATSEMLTLISANPEDLTSVLEGILATAAEFCDSDAGLITLYEGRIEFVAAHGESVRPFVGTVLPPGAQLPAGLVGSPYGVNTTDDFGRLAANDPAMSAMARSVGIRSYANAFLMLEGRPMGGIHMIRHDIRPFSDSDLSRLAAFAAQAALAIANARLFVDKARLHQEVEVLNRDLAQRVDDKVREVERLNMLRRFVTPQLAQAIADGGEAILQSHRREITVLFCDLRGFTAFAETAEPEEVMEVLREFHHAVGPMIFEHDGTIAQFTGDGMLVFFNDPVQCDEPAWNAVRLAVAMRDRTGELSSQWRRRGHELELGIGIAVGFATCGEIGFEGRTEYTAIGTVVNLAARICGIAAGGQILVTNRVHAAVEDRVDASVHGDVDFRGLSRPVPLFDVAALR